MYIANKADCGLFNDSSSLEHRRSLIGLFSEMPYLPYTKRWQTLKK